MPRRFTIFIAQASSAKACVVRVNIKFATS